MASHMQEIRDRHAEAVAQFGHHFLARGLMGMPEFVVGNQGFCLATGDDTDESREWVGIMLCAALKRLVQEHRHDRSIEIVKNMLANLAESEYVEDENAMYSFTQGVEAVLRELEKEKTNEGSDDRPGDTGDKT